MRSLALSFANGVGTTTLSRNAMGADIPATADYQAVFDDSFRRRTRRRSRKPRNASRWIGLCSTAVGDIKRFQGKLGHADRQRVEQYLTSIREVEQRMQARDNILDEGRPKFDEKGVRLEPTVKNSMQEHIELMMDLIALAFQTDMTRVVTHSLGGEGGPNYDDYKVWAKNAGASLRGAHDFHHKGSATAARITST